jgi:hypothetical protein
MRFMVMIKASADSEAEVQPEEGLLLEMGKYNEALVKAGIMVDGAGLMSTVKGARVQITDGKPLVTDGPFTEIKEVIAGFWIWNCSSLQEAIDWVANAPSPTARTASKSARCTSLRTLPPKAKDMSSTRRSKPNWRRRNRGLEE